MEPDERAFSTQIGKCRWNSAQAGRQPFAVFLRGGHPPQPPGGSGHQGRQQCQVVEKRIMSNGTCLPGSNPQMIQSCTMRTLRAIPPFLLWLALPAVASVHTPPPVQPATSFAAVEVHDDEKVAIAAEPYNTREKEAIFRVDYLSHGVMPVRLIVTNNGNRPSACATRGFFSSLRRRQDSGRRARRRGTADDAQGTGGEQDSDARPDP